MRQFLAKEMDREGVERKRGNIESKSLFISSSFSHSLSIFSFSLRFLAARLPQLVQPWCHEATCFHCQSCVFFKNVMSVIFGLVQLTNFHLCAETKKSLFGVNSWCPYKISKTTTAEIDQATLHLLRNNSKDKRKMIMLLHHLDGYHWFRWSHLIYFSH